MGHEGMVEDIVVAANGRPNDAYTVIEVDPEAANGRPHDAYNVMESTGQAPGGSCMPLGYCTYCSHSTQYSSAFLLSQYILSVFLVFLV